MTGIQDDALYLYVVHHQEPHGSIGVFTSKNPGFFTDIVVWHHQERISKQPGILSKNSLEAIRLRNWHHMLWGATLDRSSVFRRFFKIGTGKELKIDMIKMKLSNGSDPNVVGYDLQQALYHWVHQIKKESDVVKHVDPDGRKHWLNRLTGELLPRRI